jgi:hypothetical protein
VITAKICAISRGIVPFKTPVVKSLAAGQKAGTPVDGTAESAAAKPAVANMTQAEKLASEILAEMG